MTEKKSNFVFGKSTLKSIHFNLTVHDLQKNIIDIWESKINFVFSQ